jgi:UDP-glucose 4-epimerase
VRVLVTGGCGFIGKHIVNELLAHEHEVMVIDNLSTGCLPLDRRVQFHELDLRDPARHVYERAEAIIHCAAYADLRSNWDEQSERTRLLESNVYGTVCVLEQMRPVPFIFLSTASVYGAAKHEGDVRLGEERTIAQESPYSASKLACEAYVGAYAHGRAFPCTIMRLVNVVGTGTKHGVIADFVTMARKGAIHAKDDGMQRKSWVHVTDVAECAVARMRARDTRALNVSSRTRISWRDIVRIMGWTGPLTWEDRDRGAIGDPWNVHVAPSFEAQHSVEDGIREALVSLGWQVPG